MVYISIVIIINHLSFFLIIKSFLYLMIGQYDTRKKKTEFERKLKLLKKRIRLDQTVELPNGKRFHSEVLARSAKQLIPDSNYEQHEGGQIGIYKTLKFEDKTKRMKVKGYVKLFVQKLKKTIQNRRISKQKMMNINLRLEDIEKTDHNQGPNGLKFKKGHNVIIFIVNMLTAMTIFFVHFIAAFQFLFQDFRNWYGQAVGFKRAQMVFVAFSLLKIFSGFTFMITVVGKKISKLKEISMHYVISKDFPLDLLILISSFLLIFFPKQQFAGVFGLFSTVINFVNIQRMEQEMDKFVLTTTTRKQYFALMRLLLANYFAAHLIGTLLIVFSNFQTQATWMDRFGINDVAWNVKYFYALYWATTITVTVGYGDITVNNVNQSIFVTLVMLFGCLVLSYNISQVATIINILTEDGNRVRHQLYILDRLASVTQIDSHLHHRIGQYIIYSAQIRKIFQIEERKKLIQSLPNSMREEFLEQRSRNFCLSIPFLYLLQTETKILITEKFKIEAISPGEYITHKKYGLRKIYLLRRGTVGFAYKKKGSKLNGSIVDRLTIVEDTEKPELLNKYLLKRGRKLNYDILCQHYCIVAQLQKEQFINCLKESQRDFELYHSMMDSQYDHVDQWDRKDCIYCHKLKHSLFVCPQLHYMPLRNFVYLRYSLHYNQTHIQKRDQFPRFKPIIAKKSPKRLWKRIFNPIEKALNMKVQKRQISRIQRTNSMGRDTDYNRLRQFQNFISKQVVNEYKIEVDILHDYKYYFQKCNPNALVEISLSKNEILFNFQRIFSS